VHYSGGTMIDTAGQIMKLPNLVPLLVRVVTRRNLPVVDS